MEKRSIYKYGEIWDSHGKRNIAFIYAQRKNRNTARIHAGCMG